MVFSFILKFCYLRHSVASGGIVRSCQRAGALSVTPTSRPLLDILDTKDAGAPAPAHLYPRIAADDDSRIVTPTLFLLLDMRNALVTDDDIPLGETEGYKPLNFKELYGAHNHRLRTATSDA